MTRFGAVDCGTNSIRMLITDVREVDGVLEMTELHRVMEIVRLGEGVDATGRLADAALERCRALGLDAWVLGEVAELTDETSRENLVAGTKGVQAGAVLLTGDYR